MLVILSFVFLSFKLCIQYTLSLSALIIPGKRAPQTDTRNDLRGLGKGAERE